MLVANKRIPILPTLVIFVAVVIMLRLGFWQLERMEEKQIRLSTLTQKLSSGDASLTSLPESLDEAADMPVAFIGNSDTDRLIYLDNRIVEGAVGYEVLMPVETNIGWIIVNLGWVKGTHTREILPTVSIPAQNQRFSGNVVVPTLNPMISETATALDGYPLLIQQIDLEKLEFITGLSLQPFIVALTDDPKTGFKNNWRPVVMPPEKHFGYALQWFGLALAALIIYFVALLKRKS